MRDTGPVISRDRNEGTVIACNWTDVVPFHSSQKLFESHYAQIRELLLPNRPPGYTAFGILGRTGLTESKLIPMVRSGDPDGVLIIGRHDRAELSLEHDRTVALRHLAVRVTGDDNHNPIARILDLNTGQGFRIEGAGIYGAAQVSGPAFIRLGVHLVALFDHQTDASTWPENPEGVYESITQVQLQSFEDQCPMRGVDPMVANPSIRNQRSNTVVTGLQPVIPVNRLPQSQEIPEQAHAVLVLPQGHDNHVVSLSRDDLDRGVLVGRYDRCQVMPRYLFANDMVSRVHLLLFQEGDTVLAIDTASTNGTFINGAKQTAVVLDDDAFIELGENNVIRWTRVGGDRRDMH